MRCAASARASAAAAPVPPDHGRRAAAAPAPASAAPKPAAAHAAHAAALSAAAPGRRAALAAAAFAAASLAAPRRARADDEDGVVTVPGISGERWNAVDATLKLPSGWARRAGSRAKTGKVLLYTGAFASTRKRAAARDRAHVRACRAAGALRARTQTPPHETPPTR
jgi:hypothetical protein